MATSQINGVIQHLRSILRDGVGLTDGQLLEDYISHHDEAAFAALVRRHGPMVWGVCHRVLRNYHAAEDAFQATFLVLVRRAAAISSRELLANWLYGVAHQTALKARATAAKRKERERQVQEMPEAAVTQQDQWRDLQPVLDEELSRLPDKYRGVIILCDLEGKTRKEAAGQLGCAEGTVASRLARARIMLAKRLNKRGVALSGGALAAVLVQQAASAGVPNSVVVSTIKAAYLFAAGETAATGAISVKVAALTKGVVKAMFFTKLKAAFAVVLILGLVATGATIFTCRTAAGQEEKPPVAEKLPRRETEDKQHFLEKAVDGKPKALKDEKAMQGIWQVETMEAGGGRALEEFVRSTNMKYRVVIKGSRMLTLPTDALNVPLPDGTFVLNEKTSPKQIDWTVDGKTELGIYAFEAGKLKLCFDPDGMTRPTAFKTKKLTDQHYSVLRKQGNEKEGFTAWGKEIGSLQAGLGYRPGEHRAYHHGETVKLIVRVRNVGKEEVKFSYFNEEFYENPPAVTGDGGRPVPLEGAGLSGLAKRIDVNLAPGKEVNLCELNLVLRPASEQGK
jgi:RNA polymerase sigma factor (sigma-70 family)